MSYYATLTYSCTRRTHNARTRTLAAGTQTPSSATRSSSTKAERQNRQRRAARLAASASATRAAGAHAASAASREQTRLGGRRKPTTRASYQTSAYNRIVETCYISGCVGYGINFAQRELCSSGTKSPDAQPFILDKLVLELKPLVHMYTRSHRFARTVGENGCPRSNVRVINPRSALACPVDSFRAAVARAR